MVVLDPWRGCVHCDHRLHRDTLQWAATSTPRYIYCLHTPRYIYCLDATDIYLHTMQCWNKTEQLNRNILSIYYDVLKLLSEVKLPDIPMRRLLKSN